MTPPRADDDSAGPLLSAPVNLRDLGGIPVAGGVIGTGVAIRADDLSLIRPEDAETLIAGGLRAVIDLRTPAEVRNTGRGVFAELPVGYHHLSLMAELGRRGEARRVDPRDPAPMGRFYADLFDSAADKIVTALAIIAVTPGAVAFHCSAGKDRTGVLAAALLLALGAEDDDIVADYALTGNNSAAINERLRPVLAAVLADAGIGNAMTRAATVQQFDGATMAIALSTLRERHGDPLAPLCRAGLTGELRALLRARAVHEPDDTGDAHPEG